jgi:hypothetical protein
MLSFVPRTVVALAHGGDVAATLLSVRDLELCADLDLDVVVVATRGGQDHAALSDGLQGRGEVLTVTADATDAQRANQVVSRATENGSQFVWFLSPSITIETWTLGRLLRYATSAPECAVVAPRLMQPSPPDSVVWSDGGTLLPAGAIERRSAGRRRRTLPKPRPVDVDAVERLGALYRTTSLGAIGPFDEADEVDGHDVGWCLRARNAGWRTVVQQRARLTVRPSDLGERVG